MTYLPSAEVRCDYCGRTEPVNTDDWFDVGLPAGWVTVMGNWHDGSEDKHRCGECRSKIEDEQ